MNPPEAELPREVPVLVLGAGPAGLTMCLLLARHGVESLLVERRASASPLPRARGIHARAMEVLRWCGAEDAVRVRQLVIESGAQWRERLTGPVLRSQATSGPDFAEVSPCEGAAISQDVYESVLRAQVQARPQVSALWGNELESFTVRADGVDAVVGGYPVRARYLVAADGARSGVRRHLGVGLHGEDDLGRMRGIAFRADLTPWTGPVPRGLYVLTAEGAVLLATHPDGRWVINTADLDTNPTDVVRRVVGVPDLPVEVITHGTWTAVARCAEQFRHGPVFLVGDAAHQVPPAGATGISTATADVHNLAWKLSAAIHGRAGDGLLDSYDAERRPVARHTLTEAQAAWSTLRDPTATPFEGRSLRQLDMGYRYGSTAIIDDGSPDLDGPGDYRPTADPGRRAPHQWLDRDTSVLDLFGTELTLLTTPAGHPWRAKATAAVTAHTITDPAWPTLYGIGPRGAVLVRPDGHIAWRTTDLPHAATGHCAHPTPTPTPAALLDRVVAHILNPPVGTD